MHDPDRPPRALEQAAHLEGSKGLEEAQEAYLGATRGAAEAQLVFRLGLPLRLQLPLRDGPRNPARWLRQLRLTRRGPGYAPLMSLLP